MKEPKREINLKNLNSKLLVFNAVVLAAFFAVQMIITVTMGTKTQEISVLREQKNDYRLKNEILISEIEKARSSLNQKEISEKYGLETKTLYYLEEINPEAVAQD